MTGVQAWPDRAPFIGEKQLHIHHTGEDTSLWPRLRAAVSSAGEVAVVDAMDAEHASD
jgi:hypothetical protein